MARFILFAVVWAAFAAPSFADVVVRFVEGAPKDRFRISADGNCLDAQVSLTIDLEGSAGALVFDVTGAGAGVEVFQPFELVAGAEFVLAATPVSDGDRALVLELSALPNGAEVAFTIDVDDTIGAREITVSGAEIEGAAVRLVSGAKTTEARFGSDATAVLDLCAV